MALVYLEVKLLVENEIWLFSSVLTKMSPNDVGQKKNRVLGVVTGKTLFPQGSSPIRSEMVKRLPPPPTPGCTDTHVLRRTRAKVKHLFLSSEQSQKVSAS